MQSDVTITLSNMRTAIANTNVVRNMAISPGMILVPSDLIIQKEKVPGYNNVLTLATESMKFGKNTDVNYKAPPATTQGPQNRALPKTATTQEVFKTNTPSQTTTQPAVSTGRTSLTPASEVLGVTMMIGGFLISKYILHLPHFKVHLERTCVHLAKYFKRTYKLLISKVKYK